MAQDENSKNCPECGGEFKCAKCVGLPIRAESLTALYDRVEAIEADKPTLRDQFAMAALPDTQRQLSTTSTDVIEHLAKCRNYNGPTLGLIAICCYEMADSMMAARKNPPK